MNNMLIMSIMYIFLIILLVVIISVGIKMILTVDDVNRKLDDVNDKIHSFDRTFNFIDDICYKVSNLNDTIVDKVSSILHINRTKERKDNNE